MYLNVIQLIPNLHFVAATSLPIDEMLNEMTNKLHVLEWAYKKEIDIVSINSFLNHTKMHIKSLLDCKALYYAFSNEYFAHSMAENLDALNNITGDISTTLSTIQYINANINKHANEGLGNIYDMAKLERTYCLYLDMLLNEIRFQIGISKHDIGGYESAIFQIHILEVFDSSNANLLDKMQLRGRVMELTYKFCIQSLLSKIIYGVQYFYTKFVEFTYEKLQYKDKVIELLKVIDSAYNDGTIEYNCNEFSKIRTNLQHIYYLYTGQIFNFE